MRSRPFMFAALIFACLWHSSAQSQTDFNKALCQSSGKREEACSITLTQKAIVVKYTSGRNEIVKTDRILSWAAKDESVRRGFIFTRLDRRHLYTISYLSVDKEPESIGIAFDSNELNNEFRSLLNSTKAGE